MFFHRLETMKMKTSQLGTYSKALITNVPTDRESESFKRYANSIHCFPNQAVYIYSFLENRMIFTQNWEQVLGYSDNEVNMLQLVELTSPKYRDFAYEINDKALQFLISKSENLEEYSFTIELEKMHKDGTAVPLYWRVAVHKAINGRVAEIFGLAEKIDSIRLGTVMNYAAYGPEKSEFEESLSKDLFTHCAISEKELEALRLAAKGYSFKEIAAELQVSASAIEKRILPLYKRFDCKSLPHLVHFAHENSLL